MSEPTFNQNAYFTNEQLEALSKDYRTIPVDAEGHSYEPEYSSMAVRSDVLKLISDVRQARRKQYEAEIERDRLRKTLTDALKLMDKKFYGMAHKNIVEALGQEGEGNQDEPDRS
ncbi:hypothetical protein BK124_11445 [Paenibacillus amylolyticus]|uniref:hypothetical protein n=1 Tax=Paenibacillus amylolyticus TaxID=1451 RepID=UPI00096C9496|nr:hypothetical protein [Paenibacillus amylolyticus]OMF00266.1 hypothetical protein BK124_11445 [Paenibacillus amylolyticus]